MNKADYLEKELFRLIEWIKAADARISLILPLATAMLGALAALAPEFDNWTVFGGINFAFASFFLLLSVMFVAFASFPRTNGPKDSLIFFSGINGKSLEGYKDAVNNLSEEGYIEDLVNQCHVNAKIAEAKFHWVKISIFFLLLSSIPWVLSIFSFYGV